MKSEICMRFIFIGVLFSFGIVIGAVSNPSLIDLSQQEKVQQDNQHDKKKHSKKSYLA